MKAESTPSNRQVLVCQDKERLGERAARVFSELVAETLKKSEICNVALSGGSTPKLLYDRLVQHDYAGSIAWKQIAFFVSDERCVPHESQDSNFGNAARLLLDPLNIAQLQRHPTLNQDKNPAKCAQDYEKTIRDLVRADSSGRPCFDIIFLGMGTDGHCASLFPGSPALKETHKLVAKNYVERVKDERITFTFPLINAASNVVFLVAGKEKARVVYEAMSGAGDHPVEKVHLHNGKLIWLLDSAAASKLTIR